MSTTFFTSDLHLFHKRILEYSQESGTRQGSNMDEMIEILIANWNNKVQPDDTVYILGDVSFGSDQRTIEVLTRLNGTHILIRGNHDGLMCKDSMSRAHFAEVHDLKTIKLGSDYIVLCHYPLVVWDRSHYGSYHLHGHLHGKSVRDDITRSMDVGVDANPDKDMTPMSWEQVKGIIDERFEGEGHVIRSHHN